MKVVVTLFKLATVLYLTKSRKSQGNRLDPVDEFFISIEQNYSKYNIYRKLSTNL